jgi:hypothetical protein
MNIEGSEMMRDMNIYPVVQPMAPKAQSPELPPNIVDVTPPASAPQAVDSVNLSINSSPLHLKADANGLSLKHTATPADIPAAIAPIIGSPPVTRAPNAPPDE